MNKKRKPKPKPTPWVVECWTTLTPEWLSVSVGAYNQLPAAVRYCAKLIKITEGLRYPVSALARTIQAMLTRKECARLERAQVRRFRSGVELESTYHFRIRNTKTGETIPAEALGL